VEVIGLDKIKKRANEKGVTILEALVSTAIIGIGFVAVFQMVQYSIRSIDVSGERTKMNYLVSMVAEDIISDKDSKDASKKGFLKNLMDKKKGNTDPSWAMNTCKDKPLSKTNHGDAFQNKIQKWEFRFSKDRVKCNSLNTAGITNDTKSLTIFDICNNKVSGKSCNYKNLDEKSAVYEELYIGRMEANMNNGRKTKYLYFPIK
jgi:Tfp pilus assembly protein PilV